MSNKKSGLDKTSLIMLFVFFALILAALLAMVFGMKTNNADETAANENVTATDEYDSVDEAMDNLTNEEIKIMFPDAKAGDVRTYVDEDGNLKEYVIPDDYAAESEIEYIDVASAVASSKYKFESFTELTDKFMEVCEGGDVDELYHLYFPGFLEGMRLNMEEVQEKEFFDSGLRANMQRITGFDEYEYGSPELSHAGTPASYAAFIYSQVNNGKQLPLHSSEIEDCVGLVLYIDNMYETNHFMAKIGGYWYLIV